MTKKTTQEKIRTKTKELLNKRLFDTNDLCQVLSRNRSNVNRFISGEQDLRIDAIEKLATFLKQFENFSIQSIYGEKLLSFSMKQTEIKDCFIVNYKKKTFNLIFPKRISEQFYWKITEQKVVVPSEAVNILIEAI